VRAGFLVLAASQKESPEWFGRIPGSSLDHYEIRRDERGFLVAPRGWESYACAGWRVEPLSLCKSNHQSTDCKRRERDRER
jgi:hypothetical protein